MPPVEISAFPAVYFPAQKGRFQKIFRAKFNLRKEHFQKTLKH